MKVFLRTYGCRANQYDSDAVRRMLTASGVTVTTDEADADVAIMNSCTVTAAAEADLRRDIRRIARLNPGIRTYVMGCAAAAPDRDESTAPLATLPGVAQLLATAELPAVAGAIGVDARKYASPQAAQTGARALLRIQDGCDEHCTFCATTLARGVSRSRDIDPLIDEAAALAQSHPEIVITGIHIGSFGNDIGTSLGELMECLITRVPQVRFRLSSIEATEVDARLAELFTEPGRLAPHLHAPLQSGSGRILRRMGRHWYTPETYANAVSRLAERLPLFALSADVIAGFPGETDADHAATVSMVADLPFTSLHVFQYSPRPGTAATRLPQQVQSSVAATRARELRALGARKAAEHRQARSGGRADVVVIERGEGLTEDYLSVLVPDPSLPRRSRYSAALRLDAQHLVAAPAPLTRA